MHGLCIPARAAGAASVPGTDSSAHACICAKVVGGDHNIITYTAQAGSGDGDVLGDTGPEVTDRRTHTSHGTVAERYVY